MKPVEDLEGYVEKYGVSIPELHLLNIQRLGLSTNFDSEIVKLRILFEAEGNTFHKPIINNSFSPYTVEDKNIYFRDQLIPVVIKRISEDIAEPYYFRGKNVLVINSTIFNSCDQSCIFCEQNSVPEKKRRYSLIMPKSDLFDLVMDEHKLTSLEGLSQISIVTSCTGTEERALKLVNGYKEEAIKRGFYGNILFATHEIRTFQGIHDLADCQNMILAFTVECFAKRKFLMPGKKGDISLPEIKGILQEAKRSGMDSTYFYIFGIDDLHAMGTGFKFLKNTITIAPTGPNYQPQGKEGFLLKMKPLHYFLEARKLYSHIHKGMTKFEACQIYRSLWPLDSSLTRHLVK